MPERRDISRHSEPVVYCYDGSFDGLMCCVFESYDKKELPADVLPENMPLPLLLPVRTIATDNGRASRVKASVPKKMGSRAMDFLRRAFLTCHPKKDLLILKFMRLGYRCGASVMNRMADDTVHALFGAVNHLNREAHLYKGFVRFSEANGALVACIEPKNTVLPIIARHFCERYPQERFVIVDKTHGMALLYENHAINICGADAFEHPCSSEEEKTFRELWRLFYQTIEIKQRRNPRCRMSHMPKRYWRCMTEFACEGHGGENAGAPLKQAKTPLLPEHN